MTADAPIANARPALTKIVATLGPACDDGAVILRMIEAGASIFRINFGHGDLPTHEQRLGRVREAAGQANRPVAVIGDLQGPKIRVGAVADGGVELHAGDVVILQRQAITAVASSRPLRLACECDELFQCVQPGHRVLINDGAIRMLVIDARPGELECTVTAGGLVSTGKGINVPDTDLRLDATTTRDVEHVEWSIRHDLDMLAMSFVTSAVQVRELSNRIHRLRARLARPATRMPIIAKIERPAAVDSIDSIIEAADGLMVARGDLGVEMDLARVPVIQKRLLAVAQDHGKPCIVATQMLESMIQSPSPTRAEVSDVAGAIIDGADAVMLSGETAVGKHPVLAVEMMSRIARHTEAHLATLPQQPTPPAKMLESRSRTAALAHGVWVVAHDVGASLVVVWSQQGGGARFLSQMGFSIPIIAFSTDERALRQMQLLRGVSPILMPMPDDLAHFTRMADEFLLRAGWAQRDESCVLVAGGPIGRAGVTNSLAVHRVGDPHSGFAAHSTEN
jgi:pyruvate kinase